jgi:hypothetical protein
LWASACCRNLPCANSSSRSKQTRHGQSDTPKIKHTHEPRCKQTEAVSNAIVREAVRAHVLRLPVAAPFSPRPVPG